MEPLDLYHASREDLIELVLAQRDRLAEQEEHQAGLRAEIASVQTTIAQLLQQVGDLRAALTAVTGTDRSDPPAPLPPTRMPGLKAGSSPPARAPKARQRRPHGYARQRMAPTAQAVHAVEECPRCGVPLAGGTVVHRREVIEVPVVPITVTEHVWLARRCPCCAQTWRRVVDLTGVVAGQSRLGVRLVSLIATLREVGRLPVALIQQVLASLYGLSLSVGGIVGALHGVAARAGPEVEAVLAAIRDSPVVHGDESGWREDGHNGYVWTFSTSTERYFVRRGRAGSVVDEVLGDGFSGVLVTDFYAAYDHYPGLKQRCWAHLLRDVQRLCEQHPQARQLQGWATAVRALYQRATSTSTAPARAPCSQPQRAYERALLALCQPFLEDETAPQAGLCRRIAKYLPELFVFVANPRVPSTNNAAERSLRPLVTARKVSGGTRSPAGSATKMVLASLFGTWRVRGLNPFAECCRLLAAPQV